ncbi:MAG: ABC transporter permease subunit [Eubacteriales bacterium]|nr:ABC transporter permease subunit [Eubacteriales bacterium]
MVQSVSKKRASGTRRVFSRLWRERYLWLMALPVVAYYIIFSYIPMYGVTIAFKDYNVGLGILKSPWADPWYRYFQQFFQSIYCKRLIRNTLLLNIYTLLFSFPVPIIFAIMLNEVRSVKLRRVMQTVSYMPHFLSTVIVVGILVNFLSLGDGIVNVFIKALGGTPIDFIGSTRWFRTIYVASGVWQSFGWNSIVYLAAITSINVELYESARLDGCSRFKEIRYITLPSIAPTIIILLILRFGSMMSVGFEKVYLLYTPRTYEVSDVISTYVYRAGVTNAQFSFSTAVDFFNSVINLLLLVIVNRISRMVSETSLF